MDELVLGLVPGSVLARKPFSAPPKPTSNTVTLNGVTFHFTNFGPGIDPSSIGDFNGQVGVADVQGTGTATYPDRRPETLLFDTDMRFMSGSYVGFAGPSTVVPLPWSDSTSIEVSMTS